MLIDKSLLAKRIALVVVALTQNARTVFERKQNILSIEMLLTPTEVKLDFTPVTIDGQDNVCLVTVLVVR